MMASNQSDTACRAMEVNLQGRLIFPIILVGTVQDNTAPCQFLNNLTGQAAIARRGQETVWIREVQTLLIRYEQWLRDKAYALVSQVDPVENLRPGEVMRVDLSTKPFLWNHQSDVPSINYTK